MATIRKLDLREPERISEQGEVDASIMTIEFGGEKFLQIDSYGSKNRKFIGKRSQSVRLSKSAFEQILAVGRQFFDNRQ